MANADTSRADQFMAAYAPLSRRLDRYCLVLTGNREDAQDLVGDTIEQAWKTFDSIRDHQAMLSFLFTVASRRWLRVKAGRSKTTQASPEVFETLFDTSHDAERSLEASLLYDAIQRLPDELKQTVILGEIMDLSTRDVATTMGCTEVVVRVRLHRAKQRLRRELSKNTVLSLLTPATAEAL
jgi:RNA polymerase sigma-70 factor, ECF subfamily